MSRRLENTNDWSRQTCSVTGDDHSNGRAGTIAIIIEGQHEHPQPPIPPQQDLPGVLGVPVVFAC
jgi:hypothetical protein